MRTFVVLAAAAIIAFGIATYHPTQVCEDVSVQTRVYCYGNQCIAETDKPAVVCRWKY